jgi:hypothetical protein
LTVSFCSCSFSLRMFKSKSSLNLQKYQARELIRKLLFPNKVIRSWLKKSTWHYFSGNCTFPWDYTK